MLENHLQCSVENGLERRRNGQEKGRELLSWGGGSEDELLNPNGAQGQHGHLQALPSQQIHEVGFLVLLSPVPQRGKPLLNGKIKHPYIRKVHNGQF